MRDLPSDTRYEVVVVGSSWGGLKALTTVLGGLPASFPVPVVVAQHQSPDSQGGALVDLIDMHCPLHVVWAEDKDPLEPGKVFVGPPDYHVLTEGDSLSLSIDEPVQFSRPSIDVLFESAADNFGERTIGVILTGANRDGVAGLARIWMLGGLTLVQHPATAERGAMPEAAISAGVAMRVLPLVSIAPVLTQACGRLLRT